MHLLAMLVSGSCCTAIQGLAWERPSAQNVQEWAASSSAGPGTWDTPLTETELLKIVEVGHRLLDEMPAEAHSLLLLGKLKRASPDAVAAAATHLSQVLVGFPLGLTALVRHVLYACAALMAARLSAEGVRSPKVAAAMHGLRAALVAAHFRRVENLQHTHPTAAFVGLRTPVYFLHVSKSGGSTMCTIARSRTNDCKAVPGKMVKCTRPAGLLR